MAFKFSQDSEMPRSAGSELAHSQNRGEETPRAYRFFDPFDVSKICWDYCRVIASDEYKGDTTLLQGLSDIKTRPAAKIDVYRGAIEMAQVRQFLDTERGSKRSHHGSAGLFEQALFLACQIEIVLEDQDPFALERLTLIQIELPNVAVSV